MSAIRELTPQMQEYSERFTEDGGLRWLPDLMYFNPRNYVSDVVTTDAKGFRYSVADGKKFSAYDHNGVENTRLLAGNSMVFGMGATSDEWTLASRMSTHDPLNGNWVNFGSVGFNSTQELLLLILNRHLLPKLNEIVLISGFNNLGLARLPASVRGDHGAFFSCNHFFEAVYARNSSFMGRLKDTVFGGGKSVKYTSETPSMSKDIDTFEELLSVQAQIDYASDLTLNHLDMWRTVAADMGVKLTFMVQPLAPWVRPKGSAEEEALFAELDEAGKFTDGYGDVLDDATRDDYIGRLREGSEARGIGFVDLNAKLRDALEPNQWVYADRIHFTDEGHDFLSKIVIEEIRKE